MNNKINTEINSLSSQEDSDIENNQTDYQVIMSPLLSKRINSLEKKFEINEKNLSSLIDNYKNLNKLITETNQYLSENRSLLVKLFNENTALKDHHSRMYNINYEIFNELEKQDFNILKIKELSKKNLTYKLSVDSNEDENKVYVTGLKNSEFENYNNY